MSAPSAIWNPPPSATPWTAAIDRRRDLLPYERRLLAWIGDLAAPAGRHVLEVAVSPSPAIAWNDPKSRPAQNARPSPESTTARTAGSDFSASPSRRAPRRAPPSSAPHLLRPIHPHASATPSIDGAGHWSDMIASLACSRPMSLRLNLTADEVPHHRSRSVRKRPRLRSSGRPHRSSEECIEIAMQAPDRIEQSGLGRRSSIEDADKKKAIADYYGKNFDLYANSPAWAQFKRGRPAGDTGRRVPFRRRLYLRENFHRVPYMVIPVIRGRVDNQPGAVSGGFGDRSSLRRGRSCWRRASAASAPAWTTLHLPNEKDSRRPARHPLRQVEPGGLVPDRLHDRQPTSAGEAPPRSSQFVPLGHLVEARPRSSVNSAPTAGVYLLRTGRGGRGPGLRYSG